MTDSGPVKCPWCGTATSRTFLAGKQALCINSKCKIDKFTVQDFDPKKKGKDNGKKNKSYNNSGRR
jgi:uncharacterized protein (UPF0212 family)